MKQLISLLMILLFMGNGQSMLAQPTNEDCNVEPHDTCPDGCSNSSFDIVVFPDDEGNTGQSAETALSCQESQVKLTLRVNQWRSLGNNLLHSIRPMLYDIENDTLLPIINGESAWKIDSAMMITSNIGGEEGTINFWEFQNDTELGAGLYVDRPNDPFEGEDAYRFGRGLGISIRPDEAIECFEIESVTVECKFILSVDCANISGVSPESFRLSINVAGDATTGGGQTNFCLNGDPEQSCFDQDVSPIGFSCPEKCNDKLRAFPTLVGTDLGADNFTDTYYYNEIFVKYTCPEIPEPTFIEYQCDTTTTTLPNGDELLYTGNTVKVVIKVPPATENMDGNDKFLVTSFTNIINVDSITPNDTALILDALREDTWEITFTDPKGCSTTLIDFVDLKGLGEVEGADFLIDLPTSLCVSDEPIVISHALPIPLGATFTFLGNEVTDNDITDNKALFEANTVGTQAVSYLYEDELGCQFFYQQIVEVVDAEIFAYEENATFIENCQDTTYTTVIEVVTNDSTTYTLTSPTGATVEPNQIVGNQDGNLDTTLVSIIGNSINENWDITIEDTFNGCVANFSGEAPEALNLNIEPITESNFTCNTTGAYNLEFTVQYNASLVGTQDSFTYEIVGDNFTIVETVAYDNSGTTTVAVPQDLNATLDTVLIIVNDVAERCSQQVTYITPQNCVCEVNLNIETINTTCNLGGTYALNFDVSFTEGSEFLSESLVYEIVQEGIEPIVASVAYGVNSPKNVTVQGLVANGGEVSVSIADEDNSFCTLGNVVSETITAPTTAELIVDSTKTICNGDGTYSVALSIAHGATDINDSITVANGIGEEFTLAFENDGQTDIIFPNQTTYDSQLTLTVATNNEAICVKNATQIVTPNQDCKCNINVISNSISTNCSSPSSYSLTFDVTYTNVSSDSFVVELVAGFDSIHYRKTFAYQENNITTIVIDDLPVALSNVNFAIIARDLDFPASCGSDGLAFYEVPTDADCACPVTSGAVGNIETICEGNLTDGYTLSFTVDYTTSSIPDDQLSTAGFTYQVIKADSNIVVQSGSELYNTSTGQSAITVNGMNATETLSIIVEDATGLFSYCEPDTSVSFEGLACQCDLFQIGEVNIGTCDSLTGKYTASITLGYENPNSEKFSYSINDNDPILVPYANLSVGTQLVIIPNLVADGQEVTITVQDEIDASCTLDSAIVFTAPFCLPCELTLDTVITTPCNEINNTFDISFDINYINPSSQNFVVEIIDTLTNALVYADTIAYITDSIGEQTITIADTLDSNGDVLQVSIRDEFNSNCLANETVKIVESPAICVICEIDLVAIKTPIVCNGDDTYNIELTIDYEDVAIGDTFIVEIVDEVVDTFIYAGTNQQQVVTIDSLIGDETAKTLFVYDLNNPDCQFVIEEAFIAPNCFCAIAVDESSIETSCLTDSTYQLNFAIDYKNQRSSNFVVELVNADNQVFFIEAYEYVIDTTKMLLTINDLPVEMLDNESTPALQSGIFVRDLNFFAACESDTLAFYSTPTNISCTCPLVEESISNISTTCEGNLTDNFTLNFTVTHDTTVISSDLAGQIAFRYHIVSDTGTIKIDTAFYSSSSNQTLISAENLAATSDLRIIIENIDEAFTFCEPDTSVTFASPNCNCAISQLGNITMSECDSITGLYNAFIILTTTYPNSPNFTYQVNEENPVTVPFTTLAADTQLLKIEGLLGDGKLVTVLIQDEQDSTCAAAPISFNAPFCLPCAVNITNAFTTTCDPVANTSQIAVEMDYSNPSSANFVVEVTEVSTNQVIATEIFPYENDALGTQTVLLNQTFDNTGNDLLVNVYDEIANNCATSDGIVITPTTNSFALVETSLTTTCDGNGNYQLNFSIAHDEVPSGVALLVTVGNEEALTFDFEEGEITNIQLSALANYEEVVNLTIDVLGEGFCASAINTFFNPDLSCQCTLNANVDNIETVCTSAETYTLNTVVNYSNQPSDAFTITLLTGSNEVISVDTVPYNPSTENVFVTITDLPITNETSPIAILVGDVVFPESCLSESVFYDAPTAASCTCPIAEGAISNIETVCEGNLTDDYSLSFTVNYQVEAIPNEDIATAGFTYQVLDENENLLESGSQLYDFEATQTQINLTGLNTQGNLTIVVEDGTSVFNYCQADIATTFVGVFCNCSMEQVGNLSIGGCDGETGTYDVSFTLAFENPNSENFSYSVNGNSPILIPYNNTTSGTQQVVISNLAADGQEVTILVQDENDGNCALTTPIVFDAPFCLPCQVTLENIAPTTCNPSTNTYDLNVLVNYINPSSENFILEVRDSITNQLLHQQTTSYNEGVTGTQNVTIADVLQSEGQTILVTAYDELDGTCIQATGLYTSTPTNCKSCDITLLGVNRTTCSSEGLYNIIVNFLYENPTPESSVDILINDELFGQFAIISESTSINLSDLPGDGNFTSVILRDSKNSSCQQIAAYQAPNCPCAIEVETIIGDCILSCEDESRGYSLSLSVSHENTTSNEFVYTLTSDNTGIIQTDTLSFDDTADGITVANIGTFIANQEEVMVSVEVLGEENCTNSTTYIEPTCTPTTTCDLKVISSNVILTCEENNTYTTEFTVAYNCGVGGQGFFYTLNESAPQFAAYNFEALQTTVTVSNLEIDGSTVIITVADEVIPTCFDVHNTFETPACICDIGISNTVVNCTGNQTFDLTTTIDYNSSVGNAFNLTVSSENGTIKDTVILYTDLSTQTVLIPNLSGTCQNGELLNDLTITVIDQGDDKCIASRDITGAATPLTATDNILCQASQGFFEVGLNISGGIPPYTLSGDFEGTTETLGNPLVVGVFTGNEYNITIRDAVGDTTTIGQEVDCGCGTNAGTITDTNGSTEDIVLAVNETLMVQSQGVTTGANALATFVVHTESTLTAANIIGANIEGTFTLANLTGAAPNTPYFVSSIVGIDTNNDGIPDFEEACTVFSSPISFTFAIEPLVVELSEVCTGVGTEYSVIANISGGLAPYQISSNAQNGSTTELGNPVILGPFSSGNIYNLTVVDAFGNNFTASNTFSCCFAEAGQISVDETTVCAGENIEFEATGFNATLTQIYLLVDADNQDIVETSLSTNLETDIVGTYTVVGINYEVVDLPTIPNNLATIDNLIDNGACISKSNAVTIQVLPVDNSSLVFNDVATCETVYELPQTDGIVWSTTSDDIVIENNTVALLNNAYGTYNITASQQNPATCTDREGVLELTFGQADAGVDTTITNVTQTEFCDNTITLDAQSEGGQWINIHPYLTISDVNDPNARVTARKKGTYSLTWAYIFNEEVICQDEVLVEFKCIKLVKPTIEPVILIINPFNPLALQKPTEINKDGNVETVVINIDIMPNPNKGQFMTQIAGLPKDFTVNMQAFDVTGRLLAEQFLQKNHNWDVDIRSQLTTGMVFVKFQILDAEGNFLKEHIEKVIIQD